MNDFYNWGEDEDFVRSNSSVTRSKSSKLGNANPYELSGKIALLFADKPTETETKTTRNTPKKTPRAPKKK